MLLIYKFVLFIILAFALNILLKKIVSDKSLNTIKCIL